MSNGANYPNCSDGVNYNGGKDCCPGGDGDGDGDCEAIERTLITEFDFDTLASGTGDTPGDPPFAFAAGPATAIDFPNQVETGHASWLSPTVLETSDGAPFNEDFEATLTYTMVFMTGGPAPLVVSLAIEASYDAGGTWVTLRAADYTFDAFPADVVISGSLDTICPRADGSPAQPQAPRIRATASLVGGGVGATIEMTHRQLFAKQCFPRITLTPIDNCEVPAPPDLCPTVVAITVNGAPWMTGDPPILVNAGSPVEVVTTLSGPLPDATPLGSTPAGATYAAGVPSVTWNYLQPGGPQNCVAAFGTPGSPCVVDIGTVTIGGA
jgi:hypothetical protein